MKSRKLLPLFSIGAAVITALSLSTASAQADAYDCNNSVCINVTGNASGFDVNAVAHNGGVPRGYFSLTGPNFAMRWPENMDIALPAAYKSEVHHSFGAGQVCAEIIDTSAGIWISRGKACEIVS